MSSCTPKAKEIIESPRYRNIVLPDTLRVLKWDIPLHEASALQEELYQAGIKAFFFSSGGDNYRVFYYE